jgi:mRNA deadenylase 3'-5' endonuclease subunit Ccr4
LQKRKSHLFSSYEIGVDIKIVSFNILAPCYNKIRSENGSKFFESEVEHLYLKRNKEICRELLNTNADVICIQEFWSSDDALRQLFLNELCSFNYETSTTPLYRMKELRRTSHWRSRPDSVAIFVKSSRIVIQDVRNILFHDCGDRVALMLLLTVLPSPASSTTTTNLLSKLCNFNLICK